MNKKLIVCILLIITVVLFYLGINENNTNYEEFWDYTFGNIISKDIDTAKSAQKSGNIGRVELYETQLNYRLKVKYEYEINNNKYTGIFYNDGKNDKYLTDNKMITYMYNFYNSKYPLKVYFDKQNNKSSCLDVNFIKKKRVHLYYCAAFTMLLCSIISLFIF